MALKHKHLKAEEVSIDPNRFQVYFVLEYFTGLKPFWLYLRASICSAVSPVTFTICSAGIPMPSKALRSAG